MASNLRAVYTIGIDLGHGERFAGRQLGHVHRFHMQSLAWEALRVCGARSISVTFFSAEQRYTFAPSFVKSKPFRTWRFYGLSQITVCRRNSCRDYKLSLDGR